MAVPEVAPCQCFSSRREPHLHPSEPKPDSHPSQRKPRCLGTPRFAGEPGATSAPTRTVQSQHGNDKAPRRSVTLPAPVARQVETTANHRRLSDNCVLVELIELGIEASKQKEKAFFELAERFRAAKDPDESKRLGDELGRFVFGE